jgi:NAD(P)H-hydrate epimerase
VDIVTDHEMRRIDRRTIERHRIPEIVLMENAGRQVATLLSALHDDLASLRVLLLCGPGNNGGDAMVTARLLADRDVECRALLFVRPGGLRGSAAVAHEAARRGGVRIDAVRSPLAWRRLRRTLGSCDLVVDGLLGTGLSRPVEGLFSEVIEAVNRSGREVIAVDIPSGLRGDVPSIPGPAIRARHTVTFARPKVPHILAPASALCGTVHVADIGIPNAAVAAEKPRLALADPLALRRALPQRRRDSHKGDFGHVLVVAGSRGKGGAARLAALAALSAGCGLVTAAVPMSLMGSFVRGAMEVMTEGLDETDDGTIAGSALPRLKRLLAGKRAVAVGPGLTTHPETRRLVRDLIASVRVPLVLDADGLNAFPRAAGLDGRRRALLLTPHPGEMGRLLGLDTRGVQGDRLGAAQRLARRTRGTVVLKGHRSLVASPDGQVSVNPTGNPGMATAGSGDVLTGLLAGLLAQGGTTGDMARLGVYMHGFAGDLAAEHKGHSPLLARDLLSAFPLAWSRMAAGRSLPMGVEVMA